MVRRITIEDRAFFATPEAVLTFGQDPIRTCRKTEVVVRRECTEPTECETWGGKTLALPDTHFLAYVVGPDGIDWTKPRPVAKEAWSSHYLPSGDGNMWYSTARYVVPVPEGVEVTLITIEMDPSNPEERAKQTVAYPDFIAIGGGGEVYSNKASWVEKNLIPTDGRGPLR